MSANPGPLKVVVFNDRVEIRHAKTLSCSDNVWRMGLSQLFHIAGHIIDPGGRLGPLRDLVTVERVCGSHPFLDGNAVVLEISGEEDPAAVARRVIGLLKVHGYEMSLTENAENINSAVESIVAECDALRRNVAAGNLVSARQRVKEIAGWAEALAADLAADGGGR